MSQSKVTAYTTILTLMGILEEKGALAHTRSGRAYVYNPLLSRQQATRNQVHDVLTRFFDGNPEKMIENVLENEVKEPEQLGSVKNLLTSRQQENQVA
jgi:BlaI family penicillinase repressor